MTMCAQRVRTVQNTTRAERRQLALEAEEERAATQEQTVLAKQEEELAKLRMEMNMSLDALRFRYAGLFLPLC